MTVKRIAFAARVLASLCLVCAGAFGGEGVDWPRFRGANGDGVSPEKNLLGAWPEQGPPVVWRQTLGPGFSSPTIVDGRIYTLYSVAEPDTPEGEQPKGVEYAACFDLETGKELWRKEIGPQHSTNFGNGPRSSPAVENGTAYILSSTGVLLAFNGADGSVRWQKDFAKQFESSTPRWGFSNSPIIIGDMLLVQVGGGEGELFVGFDKKTGDTLWSSEDGQPGYITPYVAEIEGVRHLVTTNQQRVIALGVDGKLLWSHPWPESRESIAMPIFIPPNKFLVSAAGAAGGLAIEVVKEDGAFKAREVWKNPRYRNHFSSSVYLDGYIYGFDNATLKCVSAEKGEQQWAKRGFGKGSLISADGKLFVLSDRGQLLMVEAKPGEYRELGKFQALTGKCWTAPVISGGRLYLRNDDEMVCFDLRDRDVQ